MAGVDPLPAAAEVVLGEQPLLRAATRRHGPVALLHFDAHQDTWDTSFGATSTHGTPFRRAWEEGLLLRDRSMHVGIRGPLFAPDDLADDERFGFGIVGAMDLEEVGVAGVVELLALFARRR